jgi:diguanylate cyclase (GGDEF)-like protein
VTDPAWLTRPSFDLPLWAAATAVGLLTALLFGSLLRRLQSPDRLVALAWGAGGALALGSGWWASQILALLALLPAAGYRGEALASSWLMTSAAAALLLASASAMRGVLPRVLATTVSLLLLQAVLWHGALLAPLPALASAGAVDPVLWRALATAGLPCLLAAVGFTARRGDVTAHPLGRRLGSAAVLLLVLTGVLMQWQGLAGGVVTGQVAQALQPLGRGSVQALAGAGALAVLMAWLSALIDHRDGRQRQRLALALQQAHDQLRRQGFCDPLTGLPNRVLFEERLKLGLEHVGRSADALAVMVVDLDGFKPINDSFGHAAGDEVLREVGVRLEALTGDRNTVARIGGDQFLLLIEQPQAVGGAAHFAQRVLQALSRPCMVSAPGPVAARQAAQGEPDSAGAVPRFLDSTEVPVHLSGSIGVALFPQHGPMAKLIGNADAAMQAAKGVGGSTFAFFEPRMDMDVREQVELQSELRGAIERGELVLYYQPKIAARSGAIAGCEALVRWQHAQRGALLPSLFIPVAERFGLIGALGNWVIDEACRQIRRWLDMGLGMRVAVNLSVHQLRHDELVPRIRRALLEHRVDPRLLSFEITETVAMEDTQATLRAFGQLAQLGVSLAIDDFGTGHSSLAYLRQLPARQLKIDRSFICDLERSADALAVVDAVVRLAHALGLTVVAEGVETERQRDILQELHCDELQGFLFAKPMSARALSLWAMDDPMAQRAGLNSSLFDEAPRMSLG